MGTQSPEAEDGVKPKGGRHIQAIDAGQASCRHGINGGIEGGAVGPDLSASEAEGRNRDRDPVTGF